MNGLMIFLCMLCASAVALAILAIIMVAIMHIVDKKWPSKVDSLMEKMCTIFFYVCAGDVVVSALFGFFS